MELKKVCKNCYHVVRYTTTSHNNTTSETARSILNRLTDIVWGILSFGGFGILIWFMLFIAY